MWQNSFFLGKNTSMCWGKTMGWGLITGETGALVYVCVTMINRKQWLQNLYDDGIIEFAKHVKIQKIQNLWLWLLEKLKGPRRKRKRKIGISASCFANGRHLKRPCSLHEADTISPPEVILRAKVGYLWKQRAEPDECGSLIFFVIMHIF